MSISLAPHVNLTETDEGAVILDERRGRYWQLNQTGVNVLRRLLENRDVEAVATPADVHRLVDSLQAAGLVVTS